MLLIAFLIPVNQWLALSLLYFLLSSLHTGVFISFLNSSNESIEIHRSVLTNAVSVT